MGTSGLAPAQCSPPSRSPTNRPRAGSRQTSQPLSPSRPIPLMSSRTGLRKDTTPTMPGTLPPRASRTKCCTPRRTVNTARTAPTRPATSSRPVPRAQATIGLMWFSPARFSSPAGCRASPRRPPRNYSDPRRAFVIAVRPISALARYQEKSNRVHTPIVYEASDYCVASRRRTSAAELCSLRERLSLVRKRVHLFCMSDSQEPDHPKTSSRPLFPRTTDCSSHYRSQGQQGNCLRSAPQRRHGEGIPLSHLSQTECNQPDRIGPTLPSRRPHRSHIGVTATLYSGS